MGKVGATLAVALFLAIVLSSAIAQNVADRKRAGTSLAPTYEWRK